MIEDNMKSLFKKKPPIAFIDEHNNIIIVGENKYIQLGWVGADRAFPDSWRELVVKRDKSYKVK